MERGRRWQHGDGGRELDGIRSVSEVYQRSHEPPQLQVVAAAAASGQSVAKEEGLGCEGGRQVGAEGWF
eukprot:COSAG02_NODE_856_length_16468_cov_131.787831_9_plen_69_part_00